MLEIMLTQSLVLYSIRRPSLLIKKPLLAMPSGADSAAFLLSAMSGMARHLSIWIRRASFSRRECAPHGHLSNALL
jgi:hypothetical protein